MENYNLYLGTGKVIGIFVLILLLLELFFPPGWFIFIGLFALAVGFYELIAGISLFLSKRKRPRWFDRHIRYYWGMTGFYFLILYLLFQIDVPSQWLKIWLFVVPWGIAIYQYVIVYRLRGALIEQEEKDRWMVDQAEKNLSNSFSDY